MVRSPPNLLLNNRSRLPELQLEELLSLKGFNFMEKADPRLLYRIGVLPVSQGSNWLLD